LKDSAEASKIIRECAQKDDNIKVIGHFDADGLSGAGLMGKALLRQGANFSIRIARQLDENVIADIAKEKAALYVMIDFGSGYLEAINRCFESQCVVLDHHQIQGEPSANVIQVNPHSYGLDGAIDLSGSGVSYLVAKAVDERNADLSQIAIIGALADMQDRNKGRELLGLNKLIVKDGVDGGFIKEEKDLLFYGRETRSIAGAIASTFNPFIPELSGAEDKCHGFLKNYGIEEKEGERWRTISDLKIEEKQKIVDNLEPYRVSKREKDFDSKLVGEVYTLNREDSFSPLKDAREFGSLLNACGRMDKAGLGIAICMGDRASSFSEAKQVLLQYRKALSEGLKWLEKVPGRVTEEDSPFVLIKGEDVIDEKIIGAISTILATSRTSESDKPIVAITKTKENTVKVSARGTESLINRGLNLGEIMQKASEMVSGSGGGHNIAAGAQIPLGKEEVFLKIVKEMIDKALQAGEKAESGNRDNV
jgi:single-stranded-DNA-specific exonuclease